MRERKSHFGGARRTLAASLVALLAAAPALAAGASRYVPTMADYLGVYDALQNYRYGVEKHDQKAAELAFWPDGDNTAVPTPGGPEIRLPLTEGGPPQGRAGQPGPNAGGPPPGFNPGQPGPNAGGPPPGFNPGQPGPNAGGPPPGANAGPPGAGGGRGAVPGGVGGSGGVWHLPLDSYIHFESATRATHYEYFLSIYPQAEKQGESGGAGFQNSRTSVVGWPGHYEDILEKRKGEWRILHRKSMINQR
jgi:hypothetical protein